MEKLNAAIELNDMYDPPAAAGAPPPGGAAAGLEPPSTTDDTDDVFLLGLGSDGKAVPTHTVETPQKPAPTPPLGAALNDNDDNDVALGTSGTGDDNDLDTFLSPPRLAPQTGSVPLYAITERPVMPLSDLIDLRMQPMWAS